MRLLMPINFAFTYVKVKVLNIQQSVLSFESNSYYHQTHCILSGGLASAPLLLRKIIYARDCRIFLRKLNWTWKSRKQRWIL